VTVKVDEPPAVTDVGLGEAVGPAGETLALRLTVPAEPLVTAVLMVEVPLPPWTIETLVGLAVIEKSLLAGALTVRPTVVEWLPLVALPVMVMVYVPVAVVEAVVTVRVEEAPAVTDAGLKLAAAPAGSPPAERETVWAEPLVTAVLTV
jgi:hypothetical protein